jgi:archaellum biogenesis protein FlaJ (TadC family)
MILTYFAYAAIGKLLVWCVQTAGPFEPVWAFLESRWSKFEDMHECGWCVGAWVYTILAFLFQLDILDNLTYSVVGYIITGIVTSFLVQCISFGLQSWFGWYNYQH